MRKLTLLRHAKSSWDDPEKTDFERPLAPRGRRAALKIAAFLARHHLNPDFILCSPAQRTRETLARILPFLTEDIEIRMDRAVYSAGIGDGLVAYLKTRPADNQHIMIIGHNPTMQQLALTLAKPDQAGQYSEMERKFPSAALAHIEFDISSWRELKSDGRLMHFVLPKNLKGNKGGAV